MKFSELGIHDDLLDAIEYMGFENATPIQEQAIPEILDGKDLMPAHKPEQEKPLHFYYPFLICWQIYLEAKPPPLLLYLPANWQCKSISRYRELDIPWEFIP